MVEATMIDPCNPCSCIGGNIGDDKFKQDVLVILCDIVTALTVSPTNGIAPCEPCGCVSGNNGNNIFKQQVETLLCKILTAYGG